MIYLTNTIDDIISDFDKPQYMNSASLSRKFEIHNHISIIVNVLRDNYISEVGISIPDNCNVMMTKDLPKWNGMEQRISTVIENNQNYRYIFFQQLESYDTKIFIIVMQDIVNEINRKRCSKDTVLFVISCVLNKWKSFFQFELDYVLSDNKQQGLYGELYILEKMIAIRGENFLNCWTGCNAETHDFYYDTDALEIKSSNAIGPDKIRISNEYQLDDTGITGHLYLIFLKLKKSNADGETLPVIIERISAKLSENNKIIFYNKLLNVGYIYQLPELYTFGFRIREESYYKVEDGFPRITTKTICKGIGNVDYIVSLDACSSFQITIESFYKGVTEH